MRFVDKAAAWLAGLLGLRNLLEGVCGSLPQASLTLIGLANLAAQAHLARFAALTGLIGGTSILIIGALLASANGALLTRPQTPFLLALGLVLTGQSLLDLWARPERG